MIASVDNAILKTEASSDPRYLVFALNLPERLRWIEHLSQVGGGHRWRVSRSLLGELPLPCPPEYEQREIADTLAETSSRIDVVATRMLNQIDRLREYRQALITAAVTGQLDLAEVPA